MPPPASPVRSVAGVAVAGLVSAAGAVVLGEYDLTGGFTPLYAGALFGLVVGEVVLVAGRDPVAETATAAGFLAFGGMTFALVLSTARDVSYAGPEGWLGVLISATVAAWWVSSAARRARRSRREP